MRGAHWPAAVVLALTIAGACGAGAAPRAVSDATATAPRLATSTPIPSVLTTPSARPSPTGVATTVTPASASPTITPLATASSPTTTPVTTSAPPASTTRPVATTAPPPPATPLAAVTPVPVPPTVSTTPDAARRDCADERTLASRTTGGATTVEFVNAGAASVQFFWLDASGTRKLYGTLRSGARQTQPTFAGHPWVVSFEGGSCLVAFVAQASAGRVVIGDEQALLSFYTQTRTVDGITVKAGAKVRSAALDEAASQIARLLRGDRSVVDRLRAGGFQAAVVAQSEATTDLPEWRSLKGQKSADGRSFDGPGIRGLGGSKYQPVCSAGEENVLGLPGDVFAGESIIVHECGHSVYNVGLDDLVRARWRAVYLAAMAAGRWAGTYAALNDDEFFAELTQSYFGVNQRPNVNHNDVNGADRLKAYEPDAYAVLLSVFGPP